MVIPTTSGSDCGGEFSTGLGLMLSSQEPPSEVGESARPLKTS